MELGFQPLERRALVTRWQRHMRPTQRQQARPFIEPENPPAPSARAAEEKRARSAIWKTTVHDTGPAANERWHETLKGRWSGGPWLRCSSTGSSISRFGYLRFDRVISEAEARSREPTSGTLR
jgi:hypothetical protein